MGLEIRGQEHLMQTIKSLPATMRSNIEKTLIVGGGMIEEQAKNNIRANDSVVTGNLFQSVGTVMSQTDHDITVLVGTAVAYARQYEFGMAASEGDFDTPEFAAAILEWVKMKGIGDGDDEGTAWAITEHIREFGTQPHPFLIPAYQQHQGTIRELLVKAVAAGAHDVS